MADVRDKAREILGWLAVEQTDERAVCEAVIRYGDALERIALGVHGRSAKFRPNEVAMVGRAQVPKTDWQLAREALDG